MVVYTLEQRFAKWACDRLTEDVDFGKKNHLFRWSSFWSWRLCKQTKFLHPKRVTVWCGFFFEDEQGVAVTVNGGRYRAMLNEFSSQKFKILATFGFNRTALHATQPKLHSMFCALFLKIALSAAELMLFGHLETAIWHCLTIICEVESKISVTPTSLKNWTDRVGYCMDSRGSHLNEIIFYY